MMRIFLHKLMVDVTRQPREYITPKWSKSVVVNIFRVYEYWFGRRAGIRPDGALDGQGRMISYSWENLFAVYEGLIRAWFAGKLPKFSIVYLPQIEIAGAAKMNISPFRFAVAFDNAATGGSTVFSFSYTCTGSNGYLFSSIYGGNGSSTTLTSATYNVVNMTASVIGVSDNTTTSGLYSAYTIGPSTGANTLAMATSSTGQGIVAASYTGVNQAAPDQSVKTDVGVLTLGVITQTITTATANCWMVMMTVTPNGTPTATSNCTGRSLNAAGAGMPSSFDSNGVIATGGFTMTATYSGQTHGTNVAWSFTQAASATVNSGFFRLIQ